MEVTVGKDSRPSDETGVERLSWAVDIGRVDPATGFQDMNDAADNPGAHRREASVGHAPRKRLTAAIRTDA